MDVYIVVQQGIFMKGIAGVFANRDAAVVCAERLARDDCDSYHSYDVHKVPMGLEQDLDNTDAVVFSTDKNVASGIPGQAIHPLNAFDVDRLIEKHQQMRRERGIKT